MRNFTRPITAQVKFCEDTGGWNSACLLHDPFIVSWPHSLMLSQLHMLKTCIIYPSPAHPTRFPLRLSSSLALRRALRGGNGPAGALPATLPQHRSAGDNPSRERRPLFPCLHHPGHVEERAARRPEPTQGLSARSLLGQDRQAGSGQRTAAEAGCSYQTGVTELRRPRKERSHCLLSAAFNMSQATGSQCSVWSTWGQHRTRRVSALLWACNPTFCFCFGSCLRCKV